MQTTHCEVLVELSDEGVPVVVVVQNPEVADLLHVDQNPSVTVVGNAVTDRDCEQSQNALVTTSYRFTGELFYGWVMSSGARYYFCYI